MERAGKYVTKSDFEYALYSAENAVESNTTEVTIYSLRKKLGSEFIKSIRGVGYRSGVKNSTIARKLFLRIAPLFSSP